MYFLLTNFFKQLNCDDWRFLFYFAGFKNKWKSKFVLPPIFFFVFLNCALIWNKCFLTHSMTYFLLHIIPEKCFKERVSFYLTRIECYIKILIPNNHIFLMAPQMNELESNYSLFKESQKNVDKSNLSLCKAPILLG